jgi:hypothetical protein
MQSQVTTQKAEVLALLRKDGKINADLVEGEVDWFFEYTTPHPNSNQDLLIIIHHLFLLFDGRIIDADRHWLSNHRFDKW